MKLHSDVVIKNLPSFEVIKHFDSRCNPNVLRMWSENIWNMFLNDIWKYPAIPFHRFRNIDCVLIILLLCKFSKVHILKIIKNIQKIFVNDYFNINWNTTFNFSIKVYAFAYQTQTDFFVFTSFLSFCTALIWSE